jgi:acetoin utilization deacetylase AcuC-like enzyme
MCYIAVTIRPNPTVSTVNWFLRRSALSGPTASCVAWMPPAGFEIHTPQPLDDDVLALVHDPEYLAFLSTAHERWRQATGAAADGHAVAYVRPLMGTPWREPTNVLAQLGRYSFDVDPILEGTWNGVRASASTAVAAASAVMGGAPVAYGLARPPGHHAATAMFGGYCYLNNAALAAAWAASTGRRVAVLDIDAHHGNGTQQIFWGRSDVLTISIHGDPEHHYPFFTGHAGERGAGDGEGANVNLPLPTGAGWPLYDRAVDRALACIRQHGADLLVVALGVDTDVAHGVLALNDDFGRLGAAVGRLGLPTVFIQEGGYAPGVLETDVPALLCGYAGT